MARYPKGTYLEYSSDTYYILEYIYDVDGNAMLSEVLKSNHGNWIVGEKRRCVGYNGWTDITKEYKVLEILRKWRDKNMFSCETIRNT